MFYLYILQSLRDNRHIYYGQTNNLKRRLAQHNNGENTSTRRFSPWKIVYYEAYTSRKLALVREKQLKHYGQARTKLKKQLGFPKALDQFNRLFD